MLLFTTLFACEAIDRLDSIFDCDACGGQLVHEMQDGVDVFRIEGDSEPLPDSFAIWPVACDEGVLDGGVTGWFAGRISPADYPVTPGMLTGEMRQEVVIHRSWSMEPGGLYQVEVFLSQMLQSERGLDSWTIYVQEGRPGVQAGSLEDLCGARDSAG